MSDAGLTVPSPISQWRAARHFPDTYPGDCPPGSFVLVDDRVHALEWQRPGDLDSLVVAGADGRRPLDDLLVERQLPIVGERVPVIAYGGNRNPGTIALKCVHYSYVSPGRGNVFPALRGRLRGVDVVGAGLADQGYLYADLYADPRTTETEVEVWVLLLDRDGIRMMHDSEGVRMGAYTCAVFEGLTIEGSGTPVEALGYASQLPVFESPVYGSPIAYSNVTARNRTLPALDATQMLSHTIESLGLSPAVRDLTGIERGPTMGEELMKYLNGQFWYRRHTGRKRLAGCERVEAAIWEALMGSCGTVSRGTQMREQGAVLEPATAYEPPAGNTVGRWWISLTPADRLQA